MGRRVLVGRFVSRGWIVSSFVGWGVWVDGIGVLVWEEVGDGRGVLVGVGCVLIAMLTEVAGLVGVG